MLRDRLTFAMAVGVPILQLVLFGYAIWRCTDPRGQPADGDRGRWWPRDMSPQHRRCAAEQRLLPPRRHRHRRGEADVLLRDERAQFVQIPDDFARRVLRGERPLLLVTADATDPSAGGNAIAALERIAAGPRGPRPAPCPGSRPRPRRPSSWSCTGATTPRPVALQHRAPGCWHHPDHDDGDAHRWR